MTTPFSDTPAWVAGSVFYQIFPDRFARSDRVPKGGLNLEPWDGPPTVHGYKGGDLGGVLEHLDHLEHLGVNAILFNPIFQSASNHRYHTHDYYRVDPMLGDDELFDELIAECHRRDIRVVLDGVLNHASRGFFQFNDILENGEASAYRDWFDVHEYPVRPYGSHPPQYRAWWGLPALPEFNTDLPAVRLFLFDVVEHWTRRGIDGWRLDVPSEITTDGFWEEFRSRVRAINPDAYIVGEVWENASRWTNGRDQFDGTMNYLMTSSMIAFAAGERVDHSTVEGQEWEPSRPLDGPGYAAAVAAHLDRYHPQAIAGHLNCFSSHDTARIATIVGDDAASVELIALLALTFPGAGHVYYGEELGMVGHKEPASRNTIDWDGSWDERRLETFRSIIQVRHEHPALASTEYETLYAEGGAYAARRGTDVAIVVNAGSDPVDVPIPAAATLWGSADPSDGGLVVHPRSGAIVSLATP